MVVDHSVMVWAESYEVFGWIIIFVEIYVVDVYDFIEFADDALFCDFSEGFNVYIVSFSLIIGFGFVKMEREIIAAGTEVFGVDG